MRTDYRSAREAGRTLVGEFSLKEGEGWFRLGSTGAVEWSDSV